MQNFNIKIYEKFDKNFSYILKNKNSNWRIYCISLLQFIKPHTEYFAKYELFFTKNFFVFLIKLFKYFLNFNLKIFKWIIRLFENFLLQFFLRDNNNFKNNKTDIVFVTSIVNLNILKFRDNINKDFIFGSIINDLKKNFNVKIIYLNLTRKNSRLIFNNINKNKNILVLHKILSLIEEIKITIEQLIAFKKLIFNSSFEKNNFIFKLLLLINIFSYETKNNFRLRFQLKKILESIKPRICVVSFEGNCWEKIVFELCKKINKDCKNIGYQHGGIIKNQHHIKRKYNENFNPDYILTSGKYNRKIFSKLIKPHKIIEIGSNRHYHIKKDKLFLKLKKFKDKNCLILPEGTYYETKVMFDFSYALAKKYKDWNFILRTHPQINMEKFIKNYYIFSKYKKLKNFIFSSNSFDKDILKSTHVLYRGSTGVISAILNGLIPIYLKLPREKLNLDPIFGLKKFKYNLSNIHSFRSIVKSRRKIIKEFNFASEFCQSYFTKQDKKKTILIFKKINSVS